MGSVFQDAAGSLAEQSDGLPRQIRAATGDLTAVALGNTDEQIAAALVWSGLMVAEPLYHFPPCGAEDQKRAQKDLVRRLSVDRVLRSGVFFAHALGKLGTLGRAFLVLPEVTAEEQSAEVKAELVLQEQVPLTDVERGVLSRASDIYVEEATRFLEYLGEGRDPADFSRFGFEMIATRHALTVLIGGTERLERSPLDGYRYGLLTAHFGSKLVHDSVWCEQLAKRRLLLSEVFPDGRLANGVGRRPAT